MIPESYVADLQLRLGLYRRLADLDDQPAIEAFAAELIDRFGPLPEEVEHLLKIVAIKALCRRANVEKVDAGPKGAVIAFRDNSFADPGRADPLDRAAGLDRPRASRPEGRADARLGGHRRPAQGDRRRHRHVGAPGGRWRQTGRLTTDASPRLMFQ